MSIIALRSFSHYMVDEPNSWKPLRLADGSQLEGWA